MKSCTGRHSARVLLLILHYRRYSRITLHSYIIPLDFTNQPFEMSGWEESGKLMIRFHAENREAQRVHNIC